MIDWEEDQTLATMASLQAYFEAACRCSVQQNAGRFEALGSHALR